MEIHVIPVLDALIFNSFSNLLLVSTVHSYSILMGKNFWGFFFVYDVDDDLNYLYFNDMYI